jgi:anti-sigma regulatory factor (Ser/Thr protein kinase)
MQIDVAVDELFGNIARYAYPEGAGRATVRIEPDPERQEVSITFLDRGIPYDPLQKEDPDVTLSAEERKIGGLGIYIVKKSMDAVSYRYEDGQNILCILKKY